MDKIAFYLLRCILMMNSLKLASELSLVSSHTIKNKSNLDIIGGEMLRLSFNDLDLSYRPNIGLAAAKIEVLAFNVA